MWDEQLPEGEKWSGFSYQRGWMVSGERIWANHYKVDVAWSPVGVVSNGAVGHWSWRNHGMLFQFLTSRIAMHPFHSKYWEARNPTHGSHDGTSVIYTSVCSLLAVKICFFFLVLIFTFYLQCTFYCIYFLPLIISNLLEIGWWTDERWKEACGWRDGRALTR